jgi:hypothetical protein
MAVSARERHSFGQIGSAPFSTWTALTHVSSLAQTELLILFSFGECGILQERGSIPLTPYAQQLAEQASTEMDPAKLTILIAELCRAFDDERAQKPSAAARLSGRP